MLLPRFSFISSEVSTNSYFVPLIPKHKRQNIQHQASVDDTGSLISQHQHCFIWFVFYWQILISVLHFSNCYLSNYYT
jgi:hypothetical protein